MSQPKKYVGSEVTVIWGRVGKAVTPFANHERCMAYPQSVARQQPIGSDMTEAVCRVIGKERLCRPSMPWQADGASVAFILR